MWAVLVIPMLNEEFRRGRIFAVKNRLKEIPAKLSDLFKDILKRDAVNMDDMLLCLQWILFAKRPLRREEFYFAMVTILDPGLDSVTEWKSEQVSLEDMNSFVLNSSKGLAELTKSKSPTVQFIHESIRDFLIKDKGLSELWPDSAQDLHSSSHDRLKRCCQGYLSVNIHTAVRLHGLLPTPTSETAKELRQSLKDKFPFLEYASQYVLYHADEAAAGVPQEDFLRSFDLRHWLYITNIFAIYETRRHTLHASLMYVLAENDCGRLLTAGCHHESMVNTGGERYRSPLVAALANGHRNAVLAMLQREYHSQANDVVGRLKFGPADPPRKDQTLLAWALSREDKALAEILVTNMSITNATDAQNLEARDKDGKTALLAAAAIGSEKVVGLLCDCQASIEATDKRGYTALHWAVKNGSEPVVRTLLKNKAGVEARDLNAETALHLAAQGGGVATVQLLLSSNADIEDQNYNGETALILAAQNGHEEVVRLLLEEGADIQARDADKMTALLWAARTGHERVMQFLLSQGIDIETKSASSNTSLSWAVINGNETVVRLLLVKGANVETRDSDDRTPLSYATARGNKRMVSILLEWNANPADRDAWGKTPFLWLEEALPSIESSKSYGKPFHKHLSRNSKLPDYQMQLMLLEQQRKKRRMLDRHAPTPTSSDLLEITELMLAKLSKDDDVVFYRNKALIWAAQYGWQGLAQSLLLDGADIETKCSQGKTALACAAEKGNDTLVKIFLDNMADIEAKDDDGHDALWHALFQAQHHVVTLLVAHGANIDTEDAQGMTPLAFAVELKDERSLAALLDDDVDGAA